MALSGEEKEMRSMPSSLGNDSLVTLDHHSRPPPHIQGGGGYGGGGTLINSGGSKSRTAPLSSVPRTTSTTRYRECLKNHAAATGGKITDGCGEFMPSGEDGTLESFKCAACHCHRNFHRKEYSDNRGALVVHPLQLSPALPSPAAVHSNHHHHQRATTMVQPVKMSFGGGGGSASAATDSSSEELNFNTYQSTSAPPPPPQFVLAKRRFRTKFSQDQKEKMLAFAEKLGWRIPREDDTEMQRFCGEVGVKRHVFKIWMHNNKNSSSANNTLHDS